MASLADVTATAGARVGSYFNLVSAVPSTLFTLFAFVLINTGAPAQSPDWGSAFAAIANAGVGDVLLLALAGLTLGLVLHPLQFTLVQLYEGYWGLSALAVALRTRRSMHYRERRKSLRTQREDAFLEIRDGDPAPKGVKRVQLLVTRDEAGRLARSLPFDPDHVMPTRLGNVLRRYEAVVGSSYGLDAVRSLPHLGLVADASHLAYLNDRRVLLDLSVRLSAMSFIASAWLALVLWPYGLWLALTAVAYVMGYAFYRGAITAAHHYGTAMGAVVDLNRFTLYQRVGLGRPTTPTEEVERNKALRAMLRYEPIPGLSYRHDES